MNQYEHISAIGPSDACPFVLVVYVVVRISHYTSSLGPGQANSVVNSVCKCPSQRNNLFPCPPLQHRELETDGSHATFLLVRGKVELKMSEQAFRMRAQHSPPRESSPAKKLRNRGL